MTKADLCARMNVHPDYRFVSPTRCPEIDNWVTIEMVHPESRFLGKVIVAFLEEETAAAIWTTFPSEDFETLRAHFVEKYGKPDWHKRIEPGECGATLSNYLVHWRTKTADLYLELYNKIENGKMTGWLALNTPWLPGLAPQACLQQ
jgi:hypothetical protein